MKKLLLFLLISATSFFTFGQNLNEGFEGATFPPTGWSVINLGDANTWVRSTSYMRTGVACAYIAYSATAHNDYLVSPQLAPAAGNSTYSFWASNYSSSWPEQFNVLLSTTGNAAANFTVTLASGVTPPGSQTYTQYSYSLAAYIGQNVYIAIQSISTDQYYLMVDDVLGPPLSPTSPPTAQPTALNLTPAVSSVGGSFTAASPVPNGGYLVVASTSSTLSSNPVNGTTYTAGQALGGGFVVSTANATTFNATLLNPATLYYFFVFSYNTGGAGPGYLTTSPLTGSTTTLTASPICGTKTVGATGADYVNLTAAMTALGNSTMTCPVVLLLNANYSSASETWPIVIPQAAGSSTVNTLTIKPNTGVTATISGSVTNVLFKILNNNTIIDGSNTSGGTTQNLTITNTSATTPQVLVIGSTGTIPITNVTVKNTILINGVNSSSAVMISDATTPGNAGYFNNITFQNNSIQKAYIGLYCIANPAAGNGNGLLITGNALNTSGANSIRLCPVYVQGVDGATVTNNTIGNIANTLDASNETGIWLATSTINSTISGNTISAMSGTAGGPRAIAISSGVVASNITITGNTITNISTTTTSNAIGIYFFSTTSGCTISNNMISNIKNSNTGGYMATALYLGSTAAVSAACNVINNAIWDIAGYGYSSYVWNGIGMIVYSGFGYNIYHNTVYLNTEQTLTTGMPSAILIYSSVTNTGAIDLRNNIFSSSQTIGTNRYAIYSLAANTVFSSIDYNDYYTTGPNLGYIGSDRATLADIQAGFGGNVNSLALNPNFVGSDLHPTNAALMKKGVYLAAVPTDIAGAGRTNPPDMGVYEVSPNQLVTTTPATTVTLTGATLNGTINANNATVASGFEYGLTTAYGTSVAGVPVSVTGSTALAVSVNITGLAPCTLYHFRAKGASGAVTVNGGDLTFTTLNASPTVTPVAATTVTGTTATLNGTVNANTLSTTVTFDYGLTVAYGTTVPGVPSQVTGSSATAVSAAITGLLPATTYHYRVNGVNGCGTSNSTDMTFTTASVTPVVVTLPATSVTTTGATLNGTVNANGYSTAVTFDYGLTVAYGSTIAGTPSPVTGSVVTPVSATLTGLLTNTLYHFRVNGVNSYGTSNGGDLTFTTGCPLAAAAGTVTGPVNVCKNGTGYVYTVPVIANATSYNWTLPAGATITAGNNTNSITVSYSGTAVSGNINVYGSSICGNGTVSPNLAITVNSQPVPTVTGPATACAQSSGNVYTTQAGMTGYSWTVTGGVVTAGGTSSSNTVTITWNTVGTQTVCVNYTNAGGCTAAAPVCYTVTVNALPVPTVTGPGTLCAGATGNVYTTQAGMAGYVWTVSAGGTIIAGAGTNSLTVNWNAAGAQTVCVNYANANGCMATSPGCYNVTVNALPVPTITGPASPCVNSSGNVYTTQAGMTGYTWSVSAGGLITAGGTTNAITVTWSTAGAKTVTVNYNNANNCTAATPASYAITVNPLPVPAIAGPASVCQWTTNVVYTTQPGMTNYLWTVSPGGVITAGGTPASNTMTVTWTTAGAQSVCVNYTSAAGCTAAAATCYNVQVNPTPTPTIGSNNAPCVGSTGNMYYTESGMTNYIWTVSAGGTIASGQGTNAINVTWSGVGAQSVTVNYSNAGLCAAITPTVYNLFVNPMPNAAGAVTGTATLCAGTSGVAYSCAEILNATSYTWTLPAGAAIATGAGTKSITVNFSPTAVSGNILVSGTNSCGNGTASPAFAVTVNPLPAAAGAITGSASVCVNATGVAYSVPAIANATGYVWTVPAGATITSGGATKSIVVSYGPAAGTGAVTVKGTNSCGNGTVSPNFSVTMNAIPSAPVVTAAGAVLTSSASGGNQWYYAGAAIAGATSQSYTVTHNTGYYWCVVTTNGCSSAISNKVWVVVTGQQELQSGNFNVYPVPSDGRFTVTIAGPVQETFTIAIFNQLGAKIFELGDVQVNGTFEKEIDLRPIAGGVYSVVFLNSEHKVVRKVIISK